MNTIPRFRYRLTNLFIICSLVFVALFALTTNAQAAWGDTYTDWGLDSMAKSWCEPVWNSETSVSITCYVKNTWNGGFAISDSWIRLGTNSNPKETFSYDSGDIGSKVLPLLGVGETMTTNTVTINGLTSATNYYFIFIWRMTKGGMWYWTDVQSIKYTPGWPVLTTGAVNAGYSTATVQANLSSIGTCSPPLTLSGYIWQKNGQILPQSEQNSSSRFASPASTNGPTPFSVSFSNLQAGTVYKAVLNASCTGLSSIAFADFRTIGTGMNVVTKPVSAIASTSATFNGLVPDLGSAPNANVSFQYELASSGDWSASPASVSAGSLSAPGTFSAGASGLTAGTAYKVRALASNATYGTYYSSSAYFTTSLPASIVTTDSYTWQYTSTITLYGTLTSMDGWPFQNVGFEYGATPESLIYRTNADTSSLYSPGTFTKTNLTCHSNECNYFRAFAGPDWSSYQYGAVLPITSGSVGNLSLTTSAATGINEAGATLNGYELNSTAMKYWFQVGTSSGNYAITTGARQSLQPTSWPPIQSDSIGGLAPNTTYYFRIAGYDSTAYCAQSQSCITSYGNELSFTTGKTSQIALNVIAPASLVYGSTATLSTSGGSGSGAVSYSVGSSTGCSVSGSTLSVTNASGTCSVSATKDGDGTYNAATSAAASVTLVKASQAALTVNAPASLTYGSTSTLTTSGGSGSGAVSYSVGSSTGCSVSGSTLSVTNASGTCSLTASKAGDDNYNATTSAAASVTLVKVNTTTTIISDAPDPSLTGQPYSVSVSVAVNSPDTGTPTGTVSVSDGTGGTCTVTLSGGSGSCLLASTTTGSKTVTASYVTSTNWNTSSDTTDHTVTIANSTTTFTSDTPDPSALGESVPFSARVDPVSPAAGFPTGTVDFKVGSTVLCSGTLSSGIAACSYSALTTGDHTISAVYSGTAHFNSSSSASGTHTVELIELDDNKVSTSFTDVGNLSTSGGDTPYTFSLQTSGRLCDATNGAGNGSFEISSSILQRKPASTAGTYSICVQSVDASAGIVQRVFEVIINNPPSLVSFSLDHQTVGVEQTDVGILTPTGGQDPQVFTLEASGTLCTAGNSTGNNSFTIDGTTLKRKPGTLAGSYPICVQVKDAENELAQQSYTIIVTEPPVELVLSRNTISTAQTDVGILSLSNGQSGFIFTLVMSGDSCNATNGAGNTYFSISGNTLKLNASTPATLYPICAQAEDANHLVTQQFFNITVTEPPSDLTLSNNTVTAAQSIVGTLSTVKGQYLFTYSLQDSGSTCNSINGAHNLKFQVEGNALKRLADTSAGFYQVCLQTVDENNELFQKAFTITVSGMTPPPSLWTVELTGIKVIDGDGAGTVVGTVISNISGTTYQLVDPVTFPLATIFSLSPSGILTLNTTVDINSQPYYPIRILATNPEGATQTIDAVITVMKNGKLAGALAKDDTGQVVTGGSVTINVVANDLLSEGAASWASLEIVRYPLHGEAWIGSIIYQPSSGFIGEDSLTYRACDNLGFCVVGEVKFSINAIPSPPDTGFAPHKNVKLPAQPEDRLYTSLDELRMEIPVLAVNSTVVGVPMVNTGWDITWLGSDIGWLNGSAYPTWEGNSVLTGHLYNANGEPGVFVDLHKLGWGDQVIVHLLGKRYIYEVREVKQYLNPSAMDNLLAHKANPWLTLVTCQGYDEASGSYRWRVMVRAVMVKVE